jgi:myo-inositol-1(or 4)-monophosphatase
LNSWDTAAGVLLVREAGGVVTDLDGGPYHLGGPALLASNGLIHDEMKEVSEIAERAEKS